MTISGRIAAKEMAAIDHQLIPWLPVWLATITGRVWAWCRGQQRGEEILVPGQDERQDEGRDHARQGNRQDDRRKAPQIEQAIDQGGLLQLGRDGH